jgi:Leucine-rich repeat (LRR) protein
MRDSLAKRKAAADPPRKSGDWATVVMFTVMAVLGLSAVAGAIVFQQQRSAAQQQANVDWATEQEARAVLEQLGCLVISDLQTRHVDHVDFARCKRLDDATLQRLAVLRHLGSLNLDDTNLTDEQLRYIAGLKHLRVLLLADTRISDNGLRHLRDLPKLAGLYLGGTNVSSAGLRHLAGLRGLRVLDLRDTLVTEEGLPYLRRVDQLEVLGLSEITDAGLPNLMNMQNLKRLSVKANKISSCRRKEFKNAMPRLVIEELQDNT